MTIELTGLPEVLKVLQEDSLFADFRIVRSESLLVELQRDQLVAVLALPQLWRKAEEVASVVARSGVQGTLLVGMGGHDDLRQLPELFGMVPVVPLPLPTHAGTMHVTLEAGLRSLASALKARERGQVAERYRFELGELLAIANAMNSERDISRLLALILEKSRYVTGADAGSVYVLVRSPEHPEPQLRFEVAQNDSLSIDFRSFTIPVSERSIVGAAVIRREMINIPDLYQLVHSNPLGLEHDRSFDLRTGYQTRSVLCVPLINQRDAVIGVLQLINKKVDPGRRLCTPEDFAAVVPFDDHAVELCRMLASQAGVSLENALLYNELRRVFEGFVEASVQAIESRDPTTSGHSRRVADLTVALAEAVSQEGQGPYGELVFSPDDLQSIEYAALLHDFGKIAVPEAVLVKANKLYDWELQVVCTRFDYIRQWLRGESLRKRLELLQQGKATSLQLRAIDDVLAKQESYLDLCLATIRESNQTSVLETDRPGLLREIAAQTYVDPQGEIRPYLTAHELACLSISRGSLSAEEREQIQSHVTHTYNYLISIPWGHRLHDIPPIAGSHHEMLDGSGYPAHRQASDIPLPSKMMAIADIFDALTASDRPYKRAVPCQRALDILRADVGRGRLDAELFRLFVEAAVYRRVLPEADAPAETH